MKFAPKICSHSGIYLLPQYDDFQPSILRWNRRRKVATLVVPGPTGNYQWYQPGLQVVQGNLVMVDAPKGFGTGFATEYATPEGTPATPIITQIGQQKFGTDVRLICSCPLTNGGAVWACWEYQSQCIIDLLYRLPGGGWWIQQIHLVEGDDPGGSVSALLLEICQGSDGLVHVIITRDGKPVILIYRFQVSSTGLSRLVEDPIFVTDNGSVYGEAAKQGELCVVHAVPATPDALGNSLLLAYQSEPVYSGCPVGVGISHCVLVLMNHVRVPTGNTKPFTVLGTTPFGAPHTAPSCFPFARPEGNYILAPDTGSPPSCVPGFAWHLWQDTPAWGPASYDPNLIYDPAMLTGPNISVSNDGMVVWGDGYVLDLFKGWR